MEEPIDMEAIFRECSPFNKDQKRKYTSISYGGTKEHACTRKKRFREESDASFAIPVGSGMRPYLCDWCGKWHIGHPPKPLKEIHNGPDHVRYRGRSKDSQTAYLLWPGSV
jgi:hypothetical protein